ncbi:MAG: hypothetical protein B6D54_05625 [Epsilonproteobacteria bacterium 4484_65]|nr:MAG: hypothetical protein B6D54_05625 [Epsilonproteobacteria bacterium 4484_65]
MKILMMHNSGNVGKSLVTREVFYQNFEGENKMVLEIESRNASSSNFNMNVVRIDFDKPTALQDLTQYGIIYDDYILDVGSSEIKDFLAAIDKTREILDEFDLIVVPTIKDQKIIPDTKKTMMVIRLLGFEHKMQVLFNRVTNPSTIEEDFESLFSWAKKEKFALNPNLYLANYTESTNDLIRQKLLSSEVLQDETDYRAMAIKYHQEGDAEKSRKASNMLLTQRIAKSLNTDARVLYEKFKQIIEGEV